jgi:hypothetical protein
MLSERGLRRALYWVTAVVWVGCAALAWTVSVFDTVPLRVGFLLDSVAAGALATASLLAVFVAPIDRAYRSGYEAGHAGVQLAVGGRRKTDNSVVIPIKRIKETRADD